MHFRLTIIGRYKNRKSRVTLQLLLGVQLCFRRFPIDGFSGGRNK